MPCLLNAQKQINLTNMSNKNIEPIECTYSISVYWINESIQTFLSKKYKN